jgi:hypothetical protein
MRRRKLQVAGSVLVVLLAAVAFMAWPRPPGPGLTQENFDRVMVGMIRPEVEAILGPASARREYESPFPNSHPDEGIHFWVSSDSKGYALLVFNNIGQVSSKSSSDLPTGRRSPFDNLLWRVRRQWQRLFPPHAPLKGLTK